MEGRRATRSSAAYPLSSKPAVEKHRQRTHFCHPACLIPLDCELGLPTHANESIPRTRAKTAMSQDEGRGSLDKYRAPQTGAGGVKGES
ncbi:hypothetical protein BHE74_00027222 [Ensete ventricosum]|nr:hypothetical protein BHE74_00027222 [Ensete ventricosum]